MKRNEPGFTLIELLIVVAIIGILAAIAIPNFLEAQVRAKVAHVHSDMVTMATALEAYRVDYDMYPLDADDDPPGPGFDCGICLIPLTTPVAFITTIPHDIFNKYGNVSHPATEYAWISLQPDQGYGYPPLMDIIHQYVSRRGWGIASCGPDQWWDFSFYIADKGAIYDPSNGTVSTGDIMRTDKGKIE